VDTRDIKLSRFGVFDMNTPIEMQLRAGTIGMGLKACELMYHYPPEFAEKIVDAVELTWVMPNGAISVRMVGQWLRGIVAEKFHGVLPPIDSEDLVSIEARLYFFLIFKASVEILDSNSGTQAVADLIPDDDLSLLREGVALANADLERMLEKLWASMKGTAEEHAETAAAVQELSRLKVEKKDGGWMN
jgi:hypothetical protein